jgi:uncharacterized membrane protein YhdT
MAKIYRTDNSAKMKKYKRITAGGVFVYIVMITLVAICYIYVKIIFKHIHFKIMGNIF